MANAKTESSSSSGVQVKLVHEFPNAYLLALSPDSKCVCLYFTKHQRDTFTFRGGRWKHDNAKDDTDEVLRVLEIGTWKAIDSVRLRYQTVNTSFFADGKALYAETAAIPDDRYHTSQRVIINLQDGGREEVIQPEPSAHCSALRERTLLGVVGNAVITDALILTTFPAFKEISRAPFAVTGDRAAFPSSSNLSFSADRKMIAYGVDLSIVCRRSQDLSLVWTSPIEPVYALGAWRISMSADGNRIAAAILDTGYVENQRKYYVGVYDGRDGSLVAKLPINGYAGLAISPNGKFLAVGERIEAKADPQDVQLAVSIVDIMSGEQVARFVHDHFHIGRGEWVNSYFGINGIQFTADGKYLITSSIHTKVWELEGVS
ncbi:MAG TPA: hypothetical protein VH325_06970 [Bryobacteraceae bacterium]|nr:hypothetical protein [Bryobacteraceae bacterium]